MSSSPPKRPKRRSSSSSSLVPPVMTTAHVRRLSRVSSTSMHPSTSSHTLPRISSCAFALTPDSEPDVFPPQAIRAHDLSEHPLSMQRLGAAVDSLIRPPAKGKRRRPKDPPALCFLFSIFLAIFLLLLLLLRSFFPSTSAAAIAFNATLLRENLNRVDRNLQPRQFWPLPDSQTRASQPTPRPLYINISTDRIWQTRFLSTRNAPNPLRLTVVAACKDRTAFLQTALPGWLQILHPFNDEIVLVDWASSVPEHIPLTEVVRATPDARLAIVTLSHPAPWALSRAYNLAFSLARGQWLLKLDCDTLVRPTFLTHHPLPQQGSFYRFDWRNANTLNDRHLNGIFLARTDDIRAVYGYDERITTYGWEDTDLYSRLQRGLDGVLPPLKPIPIDGETVHHMVHDDSMRGGDQNLEMGPLLQTQVNSQATELIPSWTSIGAQQRTKFRFNVHSRDARFLSAAIVRAPTPLLDDVAENRRDDIITEAASRVLHDIYGLPWSVFDQIDSSRERLLRALTVASGRPARAEGVAGVIFVVVQGSVPDRLVAVASILAYNKYLRRTMFLTWGEGCIGSLTDVSSCKVSDFIKLEVADKADDLTMSVGSSEKKGLPILPVFQIGRWKCRDSLKDCEGIDPAYGKMIELRSFGGQSASEEQKAAQEALETFKASASGRRNLFLRLQGLFPLLSTTDVVDSIRSLQVSVAVENYMKQVGDVSDHVGLYIGNSVRSRGIASIVKRVREGESGVFFVTGSSRELVMQVREQLSPSEAVLKSLSEAEAHGSTSDARETVRQIGELLLLARCREVLNEGRPPGAVSLIMRALKLNSESV